MKNKNRYFFILLVIVLFIFIINSYYIYKIKYENELLINNIIEFKKMTETLVRGSNKWVTKEDLNKNIESLLNKKDYDKLKADLNNLDARLQSVGKTMGIIQGKVSKLEKSDDKGPDNKIEKCKDGRLIDTYGYTKNTQIKNILDSNKVQIARVEFNASSKIPWKYNLYSMYYKLITSIGKKDNGQLIIYNNLSYTTDKSNKFYPINIFESNFLQIPMKNKMFWFNPILDLNVFIGGEIYNLNNNTNKNKLSLGVDVGLSISSYGQIKSSSLFRLFRFGVGYDLEKIAAHFSFSPITFNIGEPLPLLTNLYISPQIGVDNLGAITTNLGVGVQF